MTQTPFIHLRKLEPDDLPLLYAWENDADAWQDGSTHNPLSQEDLRNYIMKTTGDIYRDGQLRLMICPSDADEPVGCVDLYDVDVRNRKAAVAIYVAKESRNQGVARQALKQTISYVSRILQFRLLYAFVRKTNTASMKAFQSAGFQMVACVPNWTLEDDAGLLISVV